MCSKEPARLKALSSLSTPSGSVGLTEQLCETFTLEGLVRHGQQTVENISSTVSKQQTASGLRVPVSCGCPQPTVWCWSRELSHREAYDAQALAHCMQEQHKKHKLTHGSGEPQDDTITATPLRGTYVLWAQANAKQCASHLCCQQCNQHRTSTTCGICQHPACCPSCCCQAVVTVCGDTASC